jgi:hypothetical protein
MTPHNIIKKKKYGLLEQKGKRSKVLICLIKGKENISSLSRRLKYEEHRSRWIGKYLKALDEKGFIIQDRIEIGKKRIIGFKIDIYKFFIEKSKEDKISFNSTEKKWLRGFFNNIDKEELLLHIFRLNGSIMNGLCALISERLLKNKEILKRLRFGEKVLVLTINTGNHLLNAKIISDLTSTISLEGGGNDWIDFFNDKVKLKMDGLCFSNDKEKDFCWGLIHEVSEGNSGEIDISNSIKQYIKKAKRRAKQIKTSKGKRRFLEYIKPFEK